MSESVEWGGRVWLDQVARGIDWLGPVSGLRVLEIGTRYGQMAAFFASRGAAVTAVDIHEAPLRDARERATELGIHERVRYQRYSGLVQDLPSGFDVVFVKSTLVLFPDLGQTLSGVASTLVDGGRLVAVENARGMLPVHLARMIARRSLTPHKANYFTRASLEAMKQSFTIELSRWTALPPTVLVCARRNREARSGQRT